MSFLETQSAKGLIKEAKLDAVKIGAGETYLPALGVFLGGTPLQIGALSTLPFLIGAIAQSCGMWLAEKVRSRRQLSIRLIRIQALLCVPIAVIPFAFESGWYAVAVLIGVAALYQITIGMLAPVWSSLAGDIIPPTSRGEFFGFRNKWMAILTFAGVLFAGQVMHYCSERKMTEWGFLVIMTLAGIARYLSASPLRTVSDPLLHVPHEAKFSFWQFISRAKHSNFVKFVFFVSFMNFSAAICGPYFAMYMLNNLSYSYHEYTLVVAAVMLAQFLVMRSWGAISDQFGNRKILTVCGTLVSFNPLLWLISSKLWFVILVQMYSGIFWAGFSLAAANFVFDAVSVSKRARCFAYQAIINGVLVFAGSLLGGFLVTQVPSTWCRQLAYFVEPSPFLVLFAISGVLRAFGVLFILPTFKEVRQVESIRGHQLLIRISSVRPIWDATFAFVSNSYEVVSGRRRGRGR